MYNTLHADPAPRALNESTSSTSTAQSSAEQIPDAERLVKAEPQASVKRGRQTNPAFDGIWTRNHAICLMGVLCDIIRGGYEVARSATINTTPKIWLRTVPTTLKAVCPWLIDAVYLNLEGSSDLAKMGLDRCFESWAANRIYYFYYDPESSEHPAYRKRGNLRLVYWEFYNTFNEDLAANREISEDQARAFWISVSDRVPFRAPPKQGTVVTSQEVTK